MAKGIKKIKWTGKGKVITSLSEPNKKLAIAPSKTNTTFEIDKWFEGTTEEEKKKTVFWIYQDRKKQIIIQQVPLAAGVPFEVNIPEYLCGPFEYYLEASLSGKRDLRNDVGLYIRGYCPAKLVGSKWSKKFNGEDAGEKYFFSYGEPVYLNIKTQGLNGHKNLRVDIFRHFYLKSDKPIRSITAFEVIDGEINLEIKNTYAWYLDIKNSAGSEQFYIKVYDPVTKAYILDDKNETDHAKFLHIKNNVVSHEIKPPTNLSPLKVGEPNKNVARYELCKFEAISITEPKKPTVIIFEHGKELKKEIYPKTPILNSIFFEIEKHDITAEARTTLNNILQYLLGSTHSTIKIEGHAYVVGKEQYNQKLSQQRSDAVKKVFVDGGLDPKRIISTGHGNLNSVNNKKGSNNKKDERDHKKNRSVDIIFDSFGHDAETIVYETIASSHDENIIIDITEYQNKACFREKEKHKKNIKINSSKYPKPLDIVGDKLDFPIKSNLDTKNPLPLQYIWPKVLANEYIINVHSCRYFSNDSNHTAKIIVYPDIKWTLEFKWNHKQPFAYTYGNKLHPHDIETGRKKVIGSEIDRGWSDNYGEMDQSFELSLEAEWDAKRQKTEIGKEFGEKIAKTLNVFNKIKRMTESISNSPLAEGKIMFEIKAPVIAVSAQWYLQRTDTCVGEIVEIGVETKPLVEANFKIDLISIFLEGGGDAICPGAGKLINWIRTKFGKEAGIKLLVIFSGAINIKGQTIINILYPKETIGEIKTTGEIKVVLEFKAWAKGQIGTAEFEGLIKADVETSVTGGLKFGADKKGIYSSPIVEFGGIVAKAVAAGSVKFGVYKKSLEYESPPWKLVKENSIPFSKYYLDV